MSKRALDHLKTDPVMAGLIDRVGPVNLRPRRLPAVRVATPCRHPSATQREGRWHDSGPIPSAFGDGGFSPPEAVLKPSPERLRSAGLSRPKASYVLGIAQKAVDGHIPELDECDRMTDAEIIERLTELKGVGRWTVEMLLIFNLGRPDVLPVDDLGVRKGFQFAYAKRKLPEPSNSPVTASLVAAPHHGGAVSVEGRRFLNRMLITITDIL